MNEEQAAGTGKGNGCPESKSLFRAQQPSPKVELQSPLWMCECPQPGSWLAPSCQSQQAIPELLSSPSPPSHLFLNFLLILHIHIGALKCILFPFALLTEILPKPGASSFRGVGVRGKDAGYTIQCGLAFQDFMWFVLTQQASAL